MCGGRYFHSQPMAWERFLKSLDSIRKEILKRFCLFIQHELPWKPLQSERVETMASLCASLLVTCQAEQKYSPDFWKTWSLVPNLSLISRIKNLQSHLYSYLGNGKRCYYVKHQNSLLLTSLSLHQILSLSLQVFSMNPESWNSGFWSYLPLQELFW